MGWQEIPDAPEGAHLLGSARGHQDMLREQRKWTGDEDAVLTEMLDDVGASGSRVEQDEVSVRINRPKHSRVCLVDELLPSCRSLRRRAEVYGIVECRDRRARCHAVDPVRHSG